MNARVKPANPLEWLLEPLEDHPTYLRRKMFGCEGAYLGGRLMLVLASGAEPWNGLLVATGRESHPALLLEWPQLQSHCVLGKWLYLSQTAPEFERIATAIVERVRKGDRRIGVEPKAKKPKRKENGRSR